MPKTGTLSDIISKQRTFAIISHPDAGKTTLTEKLLLYGGAIRQAGSVKARKAERHATSDWMEIEKQRGISVTSSVMRFDYDGYRINILDTPGHADFSEDTYRTLVAADAAIMLMDGARGVEAQTIKLFKVCRLRSIPIITFVNKMDRASRDPFDLIQELEDILGIRAVPMNWPIGVDGDFKGIYHRSVLDDNRPLVGSSGMVELFTSREHGQAKAESRLYAMDDPNLPDILADSYYSRLKDEIELIDTAGDALDMNQVHKGAQTPMFFGSAITNFGVEALLTRFLQMTLPPSGRDSDAGYISPDDEDFTGFIFKIQANMNPAHRDRLAFLRVCSGEFTKGINCWHSGTDRVMQIKQPQQFMADERESVDEAYPGDVIGLFDTGLFRLGDTISSGKRIRYEGIPLFAPENFARIAALDSMKRKQFQKGITQLAEEGAIQTFKRLDAFGEEYIIGAVGVLQFDVLEHRLLSEYNVEIRREPLEYRFVRWIDEKPQPLDELKLTSATTPALDRDGREVLLFRNEWSIRYALENNKGLALSETSRRNEAVSSYIQ
ncbi:MAG: peptide chain release factor 3 [Oscillospiraceae bacterium]|jgi:peptide chain release factor 3|nr:peptide chain release factor 3 [Oscillospiraceae bacterium]